MTAVVLYSLAVSVKMNVLLMAPGVLAVLLKVSEQGTAGTAGACSSARLTASKSVAVIHQHHLLLLSYCSLRGRLQSLPASLWEYCCSLGWVHPSCCPTLAPTSQGPLSFHGWVAGWLPAWQGRTTGCTALFPTAGWLGS